MAERDALIAAHKLMQSTLQRIVEHRLGTPGLHPEITAKDLLESATGVAEFALFQLEDKDHYPALRDLPEIPEDD